MTQASWASKVPADMTDEELREAKEALYDKVAPAQEKLNVLSSAIGQLNSEINKRFRMSGDLAPANSLPAYPLDAIAAEYGGSTES